MLVASLAVLNVLRRAGGRSKPESPARILVLHHLLLGDTILLTPLLKKLRAVYPRAHIIMTCSVPYIGLYSARPYGVEVLPFDDRDIGSIRRMFRQDRFDLTLIPAENRLSWLAAAIGSRWVVAFDGDRPAYKNWLIDELRPFPRTPMAWGDLVCLLLDGPPPAPYSPTEWPAPGCEPFELPSKPYAVLHVGASSRLRLWEPEKWRELASHVRSLGLAVVLTAGPRETYLLEEVDPDWLYRRYAATLALEQMWRLLAQADLLVCLDTGIAHLGRLVGVPSVVLFGPGSATLFGGGDFWRTIPDRKVFVPDFPCRDENMIFRRHVDWAGHCGRTTLQCSAPKCMHALTVKSVGQAVDDLISRRTGTGHQNSSTN
ncbi:MAG TPA: glycosyltransferase family 9 protein [Burkholderiales bacterium]|nr:glycosyltransferase family 9 protein [Burkholderiales bacterium]